MSQTNSLYRLEQMGLKVERTYVNKSNTNSPEKSAEESQDNSKAENSPDEQDAEDLVCMYDVEKVTCDAVALDDSDISISNVSSPDADMILSDDKALLTFDDILKGIVKCNQKNIPVQSPSPIKESLKDALERLD